MHDGQLSGFCEKRKSFNQKGIDLVEAFLFRNERRETGLSIFNDFDHFKRSLVPEDFQEVHPWF